MHKIEIPEQFRDDGGKQFPMFPPVPDGGCFRWGLCEAPAKEEP
jgi:hypothetical protein